MGPGNGVDAYRTTAIVGSSQQRLVQLLYEGLVKNLQRGAVQMRERDIEGKCQSLQKASDIVFELLSSLDFEAGGAYQGLLRSGPTRWAGVPAERLRSKTPAVRSSDGRTDHARPGSRERQPVGERG